MKTLKGRVIAAGDAEGEALVSQGALSLTYVDQNGAVVDHTSDLFQKNIQGKILVLPGLKGSALQEWSLVSLKQQGLVPKAIVAVEADTRMVVASVFCEIPTIDKLDQDPLKAIRTGDMVRVNANEGVVEILD
jgi:hypothetical protein